MYDNTTTIQYLESKFPHLAGEMRDEISNGLLHLQMAVFARCAQEVISSGDQKAWDQVRNALNVSFLEHFTFSDGKKKRRSWAYDSMPPQMQKAWDEMEEYNRKLHRG